MRQVRLSDQVVDYVRKLPPVPKKRVKAAFKELARLKGDLKDLEHPLEGYCRLRIYQFRIILIIQKESVDCLFIKRRNIVYEVFESTFLS